MRLRPGGTASLTLPEGHTLVVVVLKGAVQLNGDTAAREAQFVLLERTGSKVALEAMNEASLILSGEPINEPVLMQGPFVMNTSEQIRQAMADFRSGKFGAIPA
ncbi:pirin-like C-terminal cupin domain-containing protein [Sinorhizobium sp. 7-81]|uniref:pirin-like C-terminal cupin domain-containing protein n=1 Tax=Sinorhizobium sp. 8-89 TaxID=3049089 RepID=UPI0024C363ED|nr:pirin-like C-terminal cupin domain-containing protein [Sinorhizobium sp. 8-89]MDK1494133.1 pirin-like C-terminal cupin domain-containing protein [Sinorhizobium sp. 8-89]